MSDIITAENLQLWYGDTHALKGIDMAIPEKNITALIGPSGCGKSTFLKTLNRMNDLIPSVRITGEVRYNGRSIFDKDVDVCALRRDIGMVFQKPNPFPMSIYDNIAYGPRTHGTTSKKELDEIVEQALRDAAIWDEVKDRLKKSALGLSGGQQQRLCIARALLKKPKVLILDDFLANGKAMKGLLDVCAQAGATVGGIGICIEKGFQPGGAELRAAGYKLASLAIVDTMTDDQLTFREQ